MITLSRLRVTVLAAAAGIVLAGCSGQQSESLRLLTQLPSALAQSRAEPAQVPADLIDQALDFTDAPVAFLNFEQTGGQALTQRIATNRGYQSFATAARQIATLRQGAITSTRGFGGDMMSSDSDALLALLASRQTGTAPYTMRFLTVENLIESYEFVCSVTPGETMPRVAPRAIPASARVMTADCNNADLRVTSHYAVLPDGYVIAASQWMGPALGHVGVQTIRR